MQAVRLVEAYVFRRAICAIPTNSLNKTFATFGRALKKDRYLESIQAHLLLLPSYRRFPGDEEFKREFAVARPLQLSAAAATGCAAWRTTAARSVCQSTNTRSSTSCRRTRTSPPSGATALGPEWQRVQETWLHTLGNLTLTGYNSEYSDRPVCREARHEGRLQGKPAAAQRRPRPT